MIGRVDDQMNGPMNGGVDRMDVSGSYREGLPAAVKRLKARGVKVSMDPNFDAAGVWTPAAMLSVIRGESAVDVLMPSEVEACEITGKDSAEEAEGSPITFPFLYIYIYWLNL